MPACAPGLACARMDHGPNLIRPNLRILLQLFCTEPFNTVFGIFVVLQLSAEAKVVLTLCTPTYIQQDYTFIVNSDIYNYVTKYELL